ncbi:MAG: hypothetical protein DWI22_09355 [Planctomycetota bacterium]|nr:MAG: hypothetical protein DWI22_09355 [Planctomycetota bacterium]
MTIAANAGGYFSARNERMPMRFPFRSIIRKDKSEIPTERSTGTISQRIWAPHVTRINAQHLGIVRSVCAA